MNAHDEARAAVHLERAVREVAVKRQRQADGPQKCDAAHRPSSGQVNGTAKASRADAWTVQNTTIAVNVSQRRDGREGRAK